MVSVLSTAARQRSLAQLISGRVVELVHLRFRSGEGSRRPQGCHPVCHGPLRPSGGGAEPKPLIDRLDEAEGRIKGLLLDTAKLAAVVALSMVKYHDPSFDLQKVSEEVDLSGSLRREDIMAAVEEVVNKFDFSTN
jgi:hypothetical protein